MKDIAIFLYSKSDTIAKPWAESGVECHLFDKGLSDSSDGNIIKHGGDIRKLRKELGRLCRNNKCIFMASFTPCTDMAVCGSKHFKSKILEDANVWVKAMELVYIGLDLAEFCEIPYLIENHRTVLGTLLGRKPDFKFHPWMFGGYLPVGHQHRLYPEIYPGQDAYNKETWIWCGNGFKMPNTIPVEPVERDYPGFKKLGGKSERTKEIRSVTPEGFSTAIFKSNYQN
jgi:hypothetical protein